MPQNAPHMLKILGKSTSINVRKVLWTCTELNLPCELEAWGSGFQDTSAPDFLARNPNAMVPVMVEGEFSLWESNTICRYLAAQASHTALLPAQPRERARVEQWMDWQIAELNPSWRYAFLSLVRGSEAHQDKALLAAGVAGWNRHMAILERQLQSTGAFATGNTFTLADVVLGLSTHRWFMCPMERPSLPAVEAYYLRLSERPGFQQHGCNGIA